MSKVEIEELTAHHSVVNLGTIIADYYSSGKYRIRRTGRSITGYGMDTLIKEMKKALKKDEAENEKD